MCVNFGLLPEGNNIISVFDNRVLSRIFDKINNKGLENILSAGLLMTALYGALFYFYKL